MNELKIYVVEAGDGHPEDLDEATQGLRQELLEVDGVVVSDIQDKDTPSGTRSDMQTVLGVIGLSVFLPGIAYRVAPKSADKLIKAIVGVVQNWVDRNKDKGKEALMEVPDGIRVQLTGHSEESTQQITQQILDALASTKGAHSPKNV